MTRFESLEARMRDAEEKRDRYRDMRVFRLLYDEEREKYEREIASLTLGTASEHVRETAKE
jgi:hypothetical protein